MSERWRENGQDKEQEGLELTIIKGQELELHSSGSVLNPEEFMYAAHRQALTALAETVRHTRRFKKHWECAKKDQDDLEMELFQYSGNVIAFVGQRGAGKTQTMLSFSQRLADLPCKGGSPPDDPKLKELRNCRFFVMPPISPSALEKSNEFLYVVLSRLYRYVNRALEKDGSCLREDPGLRTELWRYFNRCVTGINGLSAGDGKAADISELQDAVDGLALRESFYKLVSLAVDRVLQKECSADAFLVLQLDDADSQIENGYGVLEDVRRYMQIPNLVILMSSDMEMLHNVVLQNHMKQFSDLIKTETVSTGILSRTCRKYIDKLIPPSHMIHLPRLEQYADLGGSNIRLRYVDEQGEPALDWTRDMPSQRLQDLALALIYKKTGIIFVSQDSPLNHIIPRSLRGLNQLLYLLSEMDDIPAIHPRDWDSPTAVAAAVLEQYPTVVRNLERFRNYFFYDWIDVKIQDKADRLFLRELVNTPRANFIREIQNYLRKRYDGTVKAQNIGNRAWTLYDLDRTVYQWKRGPLSTEEDMLFFVIGAIRTIRGHMAAWEIKRDTASKWLSPETGREHRLFACDYDPERWQITARYPLEYAPERRQDADQYPFYKSLDSSIEHASGLQMGETYRGNPIYLVTFGKAMEAVVKDWNDKFPAETESLEQAYLEWLFAGIFLRFDPDEPACIHLLQFITLLLRLEEPVEGGRLTEQKLVYQAQESALQIALNWEVTEKVCQELSQGIINRSLRFSSDSFVDSLETLFNRIGRMLKRINGGTLEVLWEQENDRRYDFGTLVYFLFSANCHFGALSAYMQRENTMFHKASALPEGSQAPDGGQDQKLDNSQGQSETDGSPGANRRTSFLPNDGPGPKG